jgi:hypothetical protein
MGFCKCPSWCPSLDSLLSYSTVKIVQINDKRLGLLHYCFMLCIFGYILGYTILYQQRYLLLQAPFGSLRMSLKSPQSRGLTPVPETKLPYCKQRNATYNGYKNNECIYWDEDFVLFPPIEATAMFVTTRVSITEQSANCDLRNSTCRYLPVSNTSHFYIADPENFTILIDHSVYANEVGIQANSQDLPGSMVDLDGHTMHDPFPGDAIGISGKLDIIHLSFLLQAAGITSLDNASSYNKSDSMRFDGVVVLVFITYSNTYTYDTSKVRYQYSARQIIGAEFKTEQPIYTKNQTNRTIWDRHGVRLVFLQIGSLGKFDFQTLLLSLVSGLGLLAVATLVVDIIATRVLPGKETYRHYKYLETPEYNAIRSGDYDDIRDENQTHVNE